MCDRCRRLQRESREVKERYAHGTRIPEKGAYVSKGRTTQNFHNFLDFEPIIWPDSIARLEQMLAMGLQKVVDSIL